MPMPTAEHVWKKGDLCRRWIGIVSRVVEVLPPRPNAPPGSKQLRTRLRIVQAFQLFGEHSKKTIVPASWCIPLTLVDLGSEYMKLANFIRDEATRLGMEP